MVPTLPVDGDRPLKILVFNPSYPPVPCGIGNYTRSLAEALVCAGHDVTVVTGPSSPAKTSHGLRVLPLLREWSIGAFVQAWPRFSRSRPDVVVSGFPSVVEGRYSRLLYFLPRLAKLTLGRPRTIFVVHEFIRTGDSERHHLRLALSAADRIVAVTEAERDAIVELYPSVAPRTIVRHNPPTTAVASPDAQADARMRAKLGPSERPIIGYIGLLGSATKGFEELLEALAPTDDALLVATGSLDPANPYHEHVATRIEQLDLGERIRWLGFVSDEEAGRMLRAVDAVALPYRGGAESGYTSLLAALVNGAAVITTRGPQNPPWLADEVTALLVESEDSVSLASAIERLLSDRGLAAKLRQGARDLSFGWEALAEAITAPTVVDLSSEPAARRRRRQWSAPSRPN